MKRTTWILSAALFISGVTAPALRAEEKPMDPAVAQLDLDGDFILFMNTSTIEERVLGYIDKVTTLVQETTENAPEAERAQATQAFQTLKAALKWSGLLSLDSYAISMAAAEDQLCRTISIASYAEGDGDKPLWRILGSEPEVLSGIQYVPADAVLAVNSTASLPETWDVVNEGITSFLPPEQVAAFQQQTMMIEMMLGTNIASLVHSLDNELLISLQLSEDKTCMLPVSGQTISIGEPSLLIGLQTRSPLLGELLLQKLQQSGAPVTQSPLGDYTASIVQLPIPAPFVVAPTLVQTDDYLLIGSSPETILAALSSKTDGNGLTSTPLYKKLLADAPAKVSGIEFLSPRLMQTYMMSITKSFAEGVDPAASEFLGSTFAAYEHLCEGGYSLKTPTGFYSKSYGDYGGMQVSELAATSYIGMMAAIAIPSFQKARNNSMEKACTNNRRIFESAKEQWAMENGKMEGADVTGADITAYLLGGFEAMTCPSGGTYTLNPIGAHAACSVHGTLQY